MQIHQMFHVSLLVLYRQRQLTRRDIVLQDQQKMEAVVMNKEFEIQEILGSQEGEDRDIHYLIK